MRVFRDHHAPWVIGQACLVAGLALTGCGVRAREPLPMQQFLLNVHRPTEPSGPSPAAAFQIRPVRVAEPYAGLSMVYRLSPVEYEQDTFHVWLAAPAYQLTQILSRWFRADDADPGEDRARTTLDTCVEQMLTDFSNRLAPRATVSIRFELLRRGTGAASVIWARTIYAEVALSPEPSADRVVQGLSQCVCQVLLDLEKELQAVQPVEQP